MDEDFTIRCLQEEQSQQEKHVMGFLDIEYVYGHWPRHVM